MNIDLRDFEEFPASVAVDFEADSADFGIEGVSFRDLMSLRLTIQKVRDEYYCQGQVMIPVEQECSRCLALFDTDLTGELVFIIKTSLGESVLSKDQGADIIHVEAGRPVVELTEVIRQALILAVPLKPLCDPECKGLCPGCGANLNEETCDCKIEEIDERWEGLKDLLE
nr:DUF177 domain-containing protein [candidate division Zixibacteria bacterium]